MVKSHSLRIQQVPLRLAFYLLFFVGFLCPDLWASQMAMVLADKAVIYSDQEMTSPIGYVPRGKKILVGEIPRNRAQVYPVQISGKIAWIRVMDVTTEKESMDSTRLTAERFQKKATIDLDAKFVLSYFAFNSAIDVGKDLGNSRGDHFFWNGISLKGEVLTKNRFDIQVLTNYMQSYKENVTFRVVELGAGAAYRLIDRKKFLTRIEAQLLAIPFSSFSVGTDYRLKSFGYTAGTGVNFDYFFDPNWAMELFGGLYYTKLLGYDIPHQSSISPVFTGMRLGAGFNYTY